MRWNQLSLIIHSTDVDTFVNFFEQAGALSVTFQDAADQPMFEPAPGDTPLWSETRLVALFDETTNISAIRQSLASQQGAALADQLELESMADRDWERVWLDDFQPMQFGERLWVCPAGMRPEDADNPLIIDLDPGLAFGTGTHPTTALCLEWLDNHPPKNLDVLDFGCGSGILAIAAAALGATTVLATDIDDQALWATTENAQRNKVEKQITTRLPDAMPDDYQANLVLANILANPLITLAETIAGYVRPAGQLVLSGILKEQADAVIAAYQPWFSFSEPVISGDWVRLDGRLIR
ncbi:MAG: 50S ribosomal protein L11 methyltransferase [Gammaproteobacteria bacterium]